LITGALLQLDRLPRAIIMATMVSPVNLVILNDHNLVQLH
jgi:hypothetical protein